MKKTLLLAIFISGVAVAQTGKVGVNTDKPTETLQVKGTTRITDIPINGSTSAIYTKTDGTASENKDQKFTATKTLVVDANGVVGAVAGLPVVEDELSKSIKYTTKTVPISTSTPTASVVSLGNISVRFNGTSASGEQSLSFMLTTNADNVIVNQLKIGSGGMQGGQNTFLPATKDTWNEIIKQRPNVTNNDFVQYNIALVNTKEIYRLTVTANKAISGTVSSPAQVTLFLERLTDQ